MICERGERERVREHLAGALRMVGARDASSLPANVRRRRERLVRELVAYRERGRYPRNETFADRRMPAFVDAHDTRCALAHLLEASGDRALVADIARARNFAFVRELADDARLVDWLDGHGFTQAEAARIQPTYMPTYVADCVCPQAEVETVLEVQRGDGGLLAVKAIHGPSHDVRIGDTRTEAQSMTTGLFVLDPSSKLVRAISLDDGDTIRCTPPNYEHEIKVTKSDLIRVLLDKSQSCRDGLQKIDKHWGIFQDHDVGGPGIRRREPKSKSGWWLPEEWDAPPTFWERTSLEQRLLGGLVLSAAVIALIVGLRRKKSAS